ncbi:MAG: hypothetical protein VB035_10115 [Candidatus Fimivivens sp.]|nr:hypothetical protein [Candidatus Fimivivens sp.]
MYFLFKQKNVMPGAYYKMPAGERLLAMAFFHREIDDLREAARDRRKR